MMQRIASIGGGIPVGVDTYAKDQFKLTGASSSSLESDLWNAVNHGDWECCCDAVICITDDISGLRLDGHKWRKCGEKG